MNAKPRSLPTAGERYYRQHQHQQRERSSADLLGAALFFSAVVATGP